MHTMKLLCGLIVLFGFGEVALAKWDGNCSNYPYYTDDCCNDAMFDFDAASQKACGDKFGFKPADGVTIANMESYVCTIDCLYTLPKYAYLKGDVLDMVKLKADLLAVGKTAPDLAQINVNAFETCSKSVSKMIESVKKWPIADKILKGKCPPAAYLIEECADNEIYPICPAKYWAAKQPECEDLKQYAVKCKTN